jgi:hypothetical protein
MWIISSKGDTIAWDSSLLSPSSNTVIYYDSTSQTFKASLITSAMLAEDRVRIGGDTMTGTLALPELQLLPNELSFRQISVQPDPGYIPEGDVPAAMYYTGAPSSAYQVNFGSEEDPFYVDFYSASGAVQVFSQDGTSYDVGGSGHAGNSGDVAIRTGAGGGGDTVGGSSGSLSLLTGPAGTGTGGVGEVGWIYANPGPGNVYNDGEGFSSPAHIIIRGNNAAAGYGGTTGGNSYIYGGSGETLGRTVLGFEPFGAYVSEVHVGYNGASMGNYTLHNWNNLYNSGLVYTDQLLATNLTANTAVYADGSQILASSTTTATELGYVHGVTSSIQTQLNGKQATGNYITALTGDVTASGPGSVAATIAAGAITNAKVSSSAAIAYSKLNLAGSIVNADISTSAAIVDTKLATIATAGKVSNSATTATSSNTVSTIVSRDGSGNFSAGTITASITGHASLDLPLTGGTLTGPVTMNASGASLILNDTLSSSLFRMYYANTSTNRLDIAQSDGNSRIYSLKAAGGTQLDLNSYPSDGTSNSTIRINRDTNTTGAVSTNFYQGNGTTNLYAIISHNTAGGNTIFNGNSQNIDYVIKGQTDANTFYLDASADSLGIGIGAPLAKLHVLKASSAAETEVIRIDNSGTGSGTAATMKFFLGGSQQSAIRSKFTSAGALEFIAGTGSTAQMTLASTGAVTIAGLGTGLVHSSSVGLLSSSLVVNADVSSSAAIDWTKMAALTSGRIPYVSSGSLTTSSNLNYDGTNFALGAAINSFYTFYASGTAHQFEVTGSSTSSKFRLLDNAVGDAMIYYEGSTKYIGLDPGGHGGKVGIGTYAPTEALHLAQGNFLHERSASGATVTSTLSNTSNTASSKANHIIKVAGSTADDAWTTWSVNGVTNWSMGIDNSDSDKFKLSRSATLGTSDVLTFTNNSMGGTGSISWLLDSSTNQSSTWYGTDTPSDPIFKIQTNSSGFGFGYVSVGETGGYKFRALTECIIPYDTSTVPTLTENGSIKVGPATGGDGIFFRSGGVTYYVNYTGSV